MRRRSGLLVRETEGVTLLIGDDEEHWDISAALTHEAIARITALVDEL